MAVQLPCIHIANCIGMKLGTKLVLRGHGRKHQLVQKEEQLACICAIAGYLTNAEWNTWRSKLKLAS